MKNAKQLPSTKEPKADYRRFLVDAYSKRSASNARYSLRAFARDLGITAAQLSFVLSGKRNLSPARAKDISAILQLSADESNLFCTLVSVQTARSETSKEIAESKLTQLNANNNSDLSLNLDAFKIISDWHHFAILQLMRTKSYQENPKWIATRLGITISEVEPAINRLARLELCEWDAKKNRHVAVVDHFFAPNGVPSDAIRKFHRQCLEKALAAIEEQKVEDRHLSTSILPVNLKDLPDARKSIQKFHKNFMKKYEAKKDLSDVVCLSVQLFKMTKNLGEEK